jgi:hypothetical protein
MELKRGDTLEFLINVTDSNTGEPIDIDITNIKSQMRTSYDKLIDTFRITKQSDIGEYLFEAQNDTNKYPLEKLYIDVEFTQNDKIQSSETFELQVIADITREGDTNG